ncbi:carboxypeptidase-like regulatory domain-containing protein [Gillisia sp. JM1]|uniref:carboxypeptidase-like regulatory domain-containing protein n=1 Tax=Gillisia sp. JM1 TaxID=1283286 RepID=UPI0003F6B66B|nr:carboxypeptidase-like regulatory domain-containing protein [Gillisia sp. JM1]
MKKNSLLLSLLLILVSISWGATFAQTVTGVVAAADIPIPGVSVIEKGTNNGVVTDFDGNYSINLNDPNAVLIFSFVGFQTQELNVAGRQQIDVSLEDEISQLDELVLVGYKSQKGRTISGALTSVNVDNLEARRVPDVAQALQGQVAGVNITQSTGAPGDEVEVRIRGNGTIGNNNPLYVIDGIPSREISFLNPSDIKSMTVCLVLK